MLRDGFRRQHSSAREIYVSSTTAGHRRRSAIAWCAWFLLGLAPAALLAGLWGELPLLQAYEQRGDATGAVIGAAQRLGFPLIAVPFIASLRLVRVSNRVSITLLMLVVAAAGVALALHWDLRRQLWHLDSPFNIVLTAAALASGAVYSLLDPLLWSATSPVQPWLVHAAAVGVAVGHVAPAAAGTLQVALRVAGLGASDRTSLLGAFWAMGGLGLAALLAWLVIACGGVTWLGMLRPSQFAPYWSERPSRVNDLANPDDIAGLGSTRRRAWPLDAIAYLHGTKWLRRRVDVLAAVTMQHMDGEAGEEQRQRQLQVDACLLDFATAQLPGNSSRLCSLAHVGGGGGGAGLVHRGSFSHPSPSSSYASLRADTMQQARATLGVPTAMQRRSLCCCSCSVGRDVGLCRLIRGAASHLAALSIVSCCAGAAVPGLLSQAAAAYFEGVEGGGGAGYPPATILGLSAALLAFVAASTCARWSLAVWQGSWPAAWSACAIAVASTAFMAVTTVLLARHVLRGATLSPLWHAVLLGCLAALIGAAQGYVTAFVWGELQSDRLLRRLSARPQGRRSRRRRGGAGEAEQLLLGDDAHREPPEAWFMDRDAFALSVIATSLRRLAELAGAVVVAVLAVPELLA